MISLDPRVTRIWREVRLQIVVHEAVIIHDAGFLQLRDQLLGRRPRWRGVSHRLLSIAKCGQDVNRAGEHRFLLFGRELGDVFVSVAVKGEFVTRVTDFGKLTWEALDAVGWSEEGGFDGVFGEEGKQAIDTYRCTVDTSSYICRVLRRAICGIDL